MAKRGAAPLPAPGLAKKARRPGNSVAPAPHGGGGGGGGGGGDDLDGNFAVEAVAAPASSDDEDGDEVAAKPAAAAAAAAAAAEEAEDGSDDDDDDDDDGAGAAAALRRKARRKERRRAKQLAGAAAAAASHSGYLDSLAAAGDPVAAAAAAVVARIDARPVSTFSGPASLPYTPTSAALAAALWAAFVQSSVGSVLSPLELGAPLPAARLACPHELIARDAVAVASLAAGAPPPLPAAASDDAAPAPALPTGISKRQLKKLRRKQAQAAAPTTAAAAADAEGGSGGGGVDGGAPAPAAGGAAASRLQPHTPAFRADGGDLPAFLKRALPTWRRALAFRSLPGAVPAVPRDAKLALGAGAPGAGAGSASAAATAAAAAAPRALGPPATPSVVIVSYSALRCVALLKPLSAFSCRVAKCFARHSSLDENAAQLRNGPFSAIAVGTPTAAANEPSET